VIPNGIDTHEFAPLPETPDGNVLVYVGNMGYLPNVDAMTHFCGEVLPLVRQQVPDAELWIVGINPLPEVQALAGEGVYVTGAVDDVRAYYQKSKVCVVPLRAGGGTRLKILESMALNRPVVSTSIGCEGLDLEPGTHLRVADDPQSFARDVVELLQNKNLRQQITTQALQHVRQVYDWDGIAAQLVDTYTTLLQEGQADG
jgi:glycosyltransferase involved in cell wall biosynthesis